METTTFGSLEVSRFILGSNPFSGFSHQSPERDWEMRHYYTVNRIKKVLRQAEQAGITTLIARGDHHILRLLTEYWDEGGKLQWICQTCPELGPPEKTAEKAAAFGAVGCYIHGGQMAVALEQEGYDKIGRVLEGIREAGMVCGVAGHEPEIFRRAEEELDVDFYMCSHYDPSPRRSRAEHVPGEREKFLAADRTAMAKCISQLDRPVIHYKVLAAGRNDPAEAFTYTARRMKEKDAVCVGVFTKDNTDMVREDVRLFSKAWAKHGKSDG